ncbi:prepilin-type N-terminal cleavage/methylation domain-containing protein [Parelusimicrobium proximum]|uniref:prepilin-type N-terminal cleavage/methylation domain-containing protein n=1 Tax=Parelusimicrobium proximum TaxID=3228953 RepID=UPI003D16C295
MSEIKKDPHPYKRGFTLLEIAVVVVIIAVLAALSVPVYQKSVERSKAAEASTILNKIRSEQEKLAAFNNGSYATTFSQLKPVVQGNKSTGDTLETRNFIYSLKQSGGVSYAEAKPKSKYDYTVRTGSYGTTNMCADGTDAGIVKSLFKGCDTVCDEVSKNLCTGSGGSFDSSTCSCSCGAGKMLVSGECKTSCALVACGSNEEKNPAVSYAEDGNCCKSKAPSKTLCSTITCSSSQISTGNMYKEDAGGCCKSKTVCTSSLCGPSEERDYSVKYQEDGSCCREKAKTLCSTIYCDSTKTPTGNMYVEDAGGCCKNKTSCSSVTCGAGEIKSGNVYEEDGGCCMTPKVCDGPSVQSCGNCGTQERTCNEKTGLWNSWRTCQNEKTCKPGSRKSVTGGFSTCTESCEWGETECMSGYYPEGDICLSCSSLKCASGCGTAKCVNGKPDYSGCKDKVTAYSRKNLTEYVNRAVQCWNRSNTCTDSFKCSSQSDLNKTCYVYHGKCEDYYDTVYMNVTEYGCAAVEQCP